MHLPPFKFCKKKMAKISFDSLFYKKSGTKCHAVNYFVLMKENMATSVLIIFLMLEQIILNIADITVGRQEKEMRKQKV